MTVSVTYAKAHMAKLVALVEAGSEVIITRWNKPVVKLVRV